MVFNKRGFESVQRGSALLPIRSTETAAGYDFFATQAFSVPPQGKAFFWTGIRAYMPHNEILMLDVRSSTGTKRDLMLANTVGIIDSDYYDCEETKGNIGICLRNLRPACELTGYKQVSLDGRIIDVPVIKDLREVNTVHILAGERIAQGVFIPFKSSKRHKAKTKRLGGFGSTN